MKVVAKIDHEVRELAGQQPRRTHLGASEIGGPCLRQTWYNFRWAYQEKHLGRMLRLFERGHEEEFRFVKYLRLAGYEVRDYSERLMYLEGIDEYMTIGWEIGPDAAALWNEWLDVSEDRVHIARATAREEGPQQWSFRDHGGHFSGSCDGKLRGPHLPDGWGLSEFKTHSEKSFNDLKSKGVISSKLGHYVQMQIYMHYLGLEWGLYLAVNKNNDELYEEIVHYKAEVAERYVDIAAQVIEAQKAPLKLSTDPSWFQCRFCKFREICHYDEAPQKNCRSCAFAQASDDKPGEWYCGLYHQPIPPGFIPKGCDSWRGIE